MTDWPTERSPLCLTHIQVVIALRGYYQFKIKQQQVVGKTRLKTKMFDIELAYQLDRRLLKQSLVSWLAS